MKTVRKIFENSILGFTLIELMIVIAIVAILAAVAIPTYQGYIKRSYLNEATTSISSIKSAEESFYTINNCYVSAVAHPASIPLGTSVAWNPATTSAWARGALGVRPDRTVRFQYEVIASNAISATLGCGAAVAHGSLTAQDCVSASTIQDTLTPTAVFGNNWYIVIARGDLDGDSTGVAGSAGTSTIVSAIDDSKVIMCNELY